MYQCRLLNLKTNQFFEKEMSTDELIKLERKCKRSKNLKIISKMKVW